MSVGDAESTFWNDDAMVSYFAAKPADPVICERLDQLAAPQGLAALDLGCGGGRHSEMLASRGFDVTAVDVNPAMLRGTAERLDRQQLPVRLARMSIASHLALESDRFDVVVSTGVLHQAKSMAEYSRAVSEVSRVMRRGGLFSTNIFTDSVWDPTYSVPDVRESATVVTREGLWMTLLSKAAFYRLTDAAGLRLEREVTEDIRQENTGPRAVLRAHFIKD